MNAQAIGNMNFHDRGEDDVAMAFIRVFGDKVS